MKLSSEQEHLVLDNQKLVYYSVRNFGVTQNSQDYEDLVSIGTIGLIKAAITFDSSKKYAFATYALKCINNEILMYYRKSSNSVNTVSLDEPIKSDEKGNVTLKDTIEDSNSNFVEEIVNTETFIKLLSIILNCLIGKKRVIILYRLGNLCQSDISQKLNISQSYISRIVRQSINIIQKIVNYQIHYKEMFVVTFSENTYRISFSTKDVHGFNKIFAALLQNLTSAENLPSFRISCNKDRIVIQISSQPEAFSFIAQIVQEIDNFNLTFVSNKNTQSSSNTTIQDVESDSESDVEVTHESDDKNKIIDSLYEGELSEISEISDTISEIENATESVLGKTKKISQSKQIRDYILSTNSFTIKSLREHFPHIDIRLINHVVSLAKKNGLVTSISRGLYSVNHT